MGGSTRSGCCTQRRITSRASASPSDPTGKTHVTRKASTQAAAMPMLTTGIRSTVWSSTPTGRRRNTRGMPPGLEEIVGSGEEPGHLPGSAEVWPEERVHPTRRALAGERVTALEVNHGDGEQGLRA